MPIKTGRYFIINVQTKNQAFLPNPNSSEPIQSRYKQDDPGEQWEVIDRKNGHHSIQNVRYPTQFAASGTSRAVAGEQVVGWERNQTWLIQKTRVKGQYTISTTDSKRFWGLADIEQGTPIALADIYTDPRNWWMFKDVETEKDAEVDPYLDNGRTAYDTAVGDMIIQAVFFELVLPPVSASQPFELDLLIIQEMPNEFIENATVAANKICHPLIKSGQLNPANLRINIVEFGSFEDVSRHRFSGVQTFDQLRNYRAWEFPWIQCDGPVIPFSIVKGLKYLDIRASAARVVVLNLRYIPLRNGGSERLEHLIYQMAEQNIILILTLSEPHLPDTLFDTDLFREFARLSSGSILSLPVNEGGFYKCIVDYLQDFDTDSVKTKSPAVAIIKPEIPLRQRKHLTADTFIDKGVGYADGLKDDDKDADEDEDWDLGDGGLLTEDDLVDDDDVEDGQEDKEDSEDDSDAEDEQEDNEDSEDAEDVRPAQPVQPVQAGVTTHATLLPKHKAWGAAQPAQPVRSAQPPPGTYNPGGGGEFGPNVPIPNWWCS